jgi:hypothetical protein
LRNFIVTALVYPAMELVMRKAPLIFLFACALAAPAQVKSANPQTAAVSRSAASLALKDGTAVHLRLGPTVSSADAHTGDPVTLEVTENVKVGGRVVIAKGATAVGTVLMPESKKVKGQVDINISEVNLADGEKAALRAKEAAVSATRTLEFFPPAPPYPYLNGKDLILPKNTLVTAFVSGDLTLDSANFPLAAQDPAPATAKLAAPPATEVDVLSTPSGAEIEVDGVFMAETPSAIAVPAGDHTISVRMAGYDTWRQLIHASGTRMTLNVQLVSGGQTGETMSCWGGTDCVSSSVGIAPAVTTKPVAQQKKKQTTDSSQ